MTKFRSPLHIFSTFCSSVLSYYNKERRSGLSCYCTTGLNKKIEPSNMVAVIYKYRKGFDQTHPFYLFMVIFDLYNRFDFN
jgi:hypothetical protein